MSMINPLWTLLPPLLVIPFILFFGERRRNLREASIILAGIILLLINIAIYQQYVAADSLREGFTSERITLLANIQLFLSVEPFGLLFAILASFLWIVTTIYSIGYMRGHNEANQTRFYTCFAIAIAAVMAAAYAGNLLTLFVAYEIITLSTFPLVTHAGTAAAKRAGRIYLCVLMGTSIVLLMPAMIIIWWFTGSLDFVDGGVFQAVDLSTNWLLFLLALIVIGTAKAGIMPVHSWLPNAMVAPTPVSALLHAVAVVKTGVFLILKVVVYIFGLELISESDVVTVLLVLSGITIVFASLIALRQDNLKARLAYSTISQLSYIIMAALLANRIALEGAGLHIVSHAFGKITLFFCAGAIMVALHKKNISEFDGIGRQMPVTMTAFLIAALSIIGLPPLIGLWSKLLIAEGALIAGQLWLLFVLMLSSLLNIAYLLPIPLRAFFRPQAGSVASSTASSPQVPTPKIKEAPIAALIAIVITASSCIYLFFSPEPVYHLLSFVNYE